MVAFGQLLRQLRTSAGLSQEELAQAAALSTRTVSDLERGINLTARNETARLLADALGLAGTGPGRVPGRGARRVIRAPAPRRRRRALPRDIASFTGRAAELRQLEAGAAAGGIWVIGGMAGVGKTAFAVRAARQLAPQFPDGQIFLPLHAHTAGQQPVQPADALASLAADHRDRARADPAQPGSAGQLVARPGVRPAAAASPGRRRRAATRSGRCCPAPAAPWC